MKSKNKAKYTGKPSLTRKAGNLVAQMYKTLQKARVERMRRHYYVSTAGQGISLQVNF